MEKIIYLVAVSIGFLLAYIFKRFRPNDAGTTVEQVRDTLDGAEQRLDASDKRTTSSIERSDDIKKRIDDSIKRVGTAGGRIESNTDRLETIKERNIEIEDIVRELRKRAENKTDGNDSH